MGLLQQHSSLDRPDSITGDRDGIDDVENTVKGCQAVKRGFVPEDFHANLTPEVRDKQARVKIAC